MRVLYFTTIGSTNDVAASLAAEPGSRRHGRHRGCPDGRPRAPRPRLVFSAGSGLYVSVILSPSRAVSDPDGRPRCSRLPPGSRSRKGLSAPRVFRPRSSGRTTCWSRGASSLGFLRRHSATWWSLDTASMSGRWRIPRSFATARRRSRRSSDVRSIAPWSPSRRSPRWRRATTTSSAAVSMLFSTRGGAAPRRIAARALSGIRPPGRSPASLMVLTRSVPCWSGCRDRVERIVAGEVRWI